MSRKAHVQGVRQAAAGVAVQHDRRTEDVVEPLPEVGRHLGEPIGTRMLPRKPARGAEAHREQRALRAGPSPPFVRGAVDERLQVQPAPHIQRADALWRIALVTGDAQQVDAEVVDAGGELADRLRGVGVERDAARARDGADLGDRLHGADLVVRVHHADKHGLRGEGVANLCRVDQTGGVDREPRHASAERFEEAARGQDRGVFDLGRDDVRRVDRRATTEEDAFEIAARTSGAIGVLALKSR